MSKIGSSTGSVGPAGSLASSAESERTPERSAPPGELTVRPASAARAVLDFGFEESKKA